MDPASRATRGDGGQRHRRPAPGDAQGEGAAEQAGEPRQREHRTAGVDRGQEREPLLPPRDRPGREVGERLSRGEHAGDEVGAHRDRAAEEEVGRREDGEGRDGEPAVDRREVADDQAEREADPGRDHPLGPEEAGAQPDERDRHERPRRRPASTRASRSGTARRQQAGLVGVAAPAGPARGAAAQRGREPGALGRARVVGGLVAAHASAPEKRTRRRSVSSRTWSSTRSPTRWTPTCSWSSTTMATLMTSGSNWPRVRCTWMKGRRHAGDEHGDAGVGGEGRRLAGRAEHVDRPDLGPREGVEGQGRGGARDRLAVADDGRVLLVEDRAHREGGGARDGELDVILTAGVDVGRGVDDDREVRAAGVEELPDEEPAVLGRGAPVDVAAVVAGLVLAQGVEGEVGHRQVGRHLALEVAQEAGAEALERDGQRVDEQLGALGPRDGAPDEAERVAVHRRGRADRDDAAVPGRDDEELLVGAARRRGRAA